MFARSREVSFHENLSTTCCKLFLLHSCTRRIYYHMKPHPRGRPAVRRSIPLVCYARGLAHTKIHTSEAAWTPKYMQLIQEKKGPAGPMRNSQQITVAKLLFKYVFLTYRKSFWDILTVVANASSVPRNPTFREFHWQGLVSLINDLFLHRFLQIRVHAKHRKGDPS